MEVHKDAQQQDDEVVIQVPIAASMLETRTGQLDDALNEKLENAYHSETAQVFYHNVAKIASEHDPIDLAFAVSKLPAHARVVVYENLPDEHDKIIFIINTTSSTRTAIFRSIDDEEIKMLVEQMPPDEAVWVLDDLTDRRLKRVLELLDPKKAQRIRELQAHDRHSAGRLMTNEFFAFPLHTTIGEVKAVVRKNPGVEVTRHVFVLNSDGELIGFVPGRNLLVNPEQLPIRQVMRPVLHSVGPDASRDEVVDLVVRYKESTLPVVEPQTGQLLGVITMEDVVEVMEDIADETIASFAGTAEDVSEHEPIYKRFLLRAPWLVVTVCAGLTTATAMNLLADRLWFAILPFFVPLIAGMSGNVGIQCSTILVRGISTGEYTSRSIGEAMTKELGIGLLIGSIFGLACGSVVYLFSWLGLQNSGGDTLALTLTVALGVFCACMNAALLGSFSPFFFARLRIDPAVASGPIVTAFNDVVSTLIFFTVARLVYALF